MPPLYPSTLSDADLLSTTRLAAEQEREATARLVALLAEVDARRLYLGQGCSSMFAFCTRGLHLSEHAAYARIEAARASRRFCGILEQLADGRLSLTTVGLLSPHLTEENCEALLDAAQHKSKREVEHLIADLHPQPDVQATMRALAGRTPAMTGFRESEPTAESASPTPAEAADLPLSASPASHQWGVVAPLAPRRYLLRVTIHESTQRTLERARDLLRHEIPDGNLADLIDRALTLLVVQAERVKFAATHQAAARRADAKPNARSRRIPAAIRREVWTRDGGRCAFTGRAGRCVETGFLEFHHIVPFAAGGPSSVDNLPLRCRAHNRDEAERAGLALWRPPATRSGPS